MQITLASILILLGSGLSFAAGPSNTASEGSGDKTTGYVYYCSDGDTCRLSVAGGSMWMNVRLFGIDAPETAKQRGRKRGQPMGDSAKDFLNTMLKGKDVSVVQADLDPYNRPVVELFVDGQSANLAMIEKGYAEVYRGKTKRIDRKRFEDAELVAKQNKAGIWAQAGYQSPSEFRKAQK